MNDDKIRFTIFIVAFTCFIIGSVAVGVVMWKNPSMTDREIILNYPVAVITEFASAIVMTVAVTIEK